MRAKEVFMSADLSKKPRESNAFVKKYLDNWMKKALDRLEKHQNVFKRSYIRSK